MHVATVAGIGLGTALATGLGALLVKAARVDEQRSIALSSSVAAGFMLGAAAGLFYEGVRLDPARTVVGAVVGVSFIFVTRAFLSGRRDAHIGNLRGARGIAAVMVVGVMTIHSFTEGVAVGVSLAGRESLGLLISTAIAVHNIPEGVAISLTMIPFGVGAWRAAWWSVFSSLPQPLMAVPAFVAVSAFEPLLPTGLGFAGGAMVWMVATQLVPEAWAAGTKAATSVAVVCSMAVMIAFEMAIGF